MRLNKWVMLVIYFFFFLSFGYLSYSEFKNDGKFGFLMGGCSLLSAYQIIILFIRKKGESWNRKYVIADHRIIHQILFSLSISYIYIILFLVVGLIGLYNGFIAANPIDMMAGAIITSSLIFMTLQIIQRFIR